MLHKRGRTRVLIIGAMILLIIGAFTLYSVLPRQGISLSVSPQSAQVYQQIAVTGNISPTVPSGQVTLTYTKPDGTTIQHTAQISMNSFFADVITPDMAGTWRVIASYSGATNSATFSIRDALGANIVTCQTDYSAATVGTVIHVSGAVISGGASISSTAVTISISSDGGSTWSNLATINVVLDSAVHGTYSYTWNTSSFTPATYLIKASWNGGESSSSSLALHSAT